jgi:hypothetical protein
VHPCTHISEEDLLELALVRWDYMMEIEELQNWSRGGEPLKRTREDRPEYWKEEFDKAREREELIKM